MIDIHCHILPAFDDGASDIYETVKMAEIAYNSGIRTIVTTPHCNIPGICHNYYSSHYDEVFNEAVKAIKKENIELTLLKGMEVFVTFDLPSLIKDDKILTLNNSRYLLVEFDFCEDPEFVLFMIKRIAKLGLVPVVAHPERYEFIKETPELLIQLKKAGCVFQVNKGSFVGNYGKTSKALAFDMLNNNLITAIASDAHSSDIRTPDMHKSKSLIADFCDTDMLFSKNPQKICQNQPL